jgi:hypothetical protein
MGYVVFKYITNDQVDGAAVGTYCILLWLDYDADEGTATIMVACDDTPGDVGEATQEDAEDEYLGPAWDEYFWDLNEYERE